MEELLLGSPGRQGQLTHLQPVLSSAGNSSGGGGGDGCAALEAPAGRCWRLLQPLTPFQALAEAEACARHRGPRGPAPGPHPRLTPPPPPLPPPVTAARLHPGTRRGGGAPQEGCVGREGCQGEAELGEKRCQLPPGSPAPDPTPFPHWSPLPFVRSSPVGLGGASEPNSLPGIRPSPLCLHAPNPGPGLPLLPQGSRSGKEWTVGALTPWEGGCARNAEMEAEDQEEGVDGGAAERVPLDARVNLPISSLVSAAQATAAAAMAAMAARSSRPRRGDAGVCCSL